MKKHLFIAILVFTNLASTLAQNKSELFAQQNYQALIKSCTPPSHSDDYIWLAQSYKAQGDLLKALNILQASPDTSTTSQTQALKADINFSLGHFVQAREYYKATAKDDASFFRLMQVYENTGNYMECITKINQRIDSTSTNVALLSILANSYLKKDAKIMAKNTYHRIYAIDSLNTNAAYKVAYLLFKEQKEAPIREALEIINKILENDPDNMRFVRLQGRIYYLLEKYRASMHAYEKLYKAGYTDEVTLQKLGYSEYKNGFCREAAEHLEKAYIKDPTNYYTNLYLGMSHTALNNPKLALDFLDQAEELLKPAPEQLANLCWERQWCYIKQKQYLKADSCLHQLLKYSNDDMNYYHIATNYDKNLKDKDNAIKYYETFIDRREKDPKSKSRTNSFVELAKYRIKQLKEDKFWGE